MRGLGIECVGAALLAAAKYAIVYVWRGERGRGSVGMDVCVCGCGCDCVEVWRCDCMGEEESVWVGQP